MISFSFSIEKKIIHKDIRGKHRYMCRAKCIYIALAVMIRKANPSPWLQWRFIGPTSTNHDNVYQSTNSLKISCISLHYTYIHPHCKLSLPGCTLVIKPSVKAITELTQSRNLLVNVIQLFAVIWKFPDSF